MGRGRKKVISGKRIFSERKGDEKLISSPSKSTTTSHDQSSVDNVQGSLELPAGVEGNFNETIEKDTEKLAQKDGENQPTASKSAECLHEAEEGLREEISEKEKQCGALAYDKNCLQAEVLKLNEEIQAISTEFQAASKAWQLEKDELLSEIVAARKECDEISIENGRALLQYREEKAELECGLNDSKARCQELLDKFVEEKHRWDSEKANLESNGAMLQTSLESMAAERGLLHHQNRELRTEVESLKAKFNESNVAVAQLEDQLSSLAAAKKFLEEENNFLQTEMDRRTLVSEEKVVILKKNVGELETALGSLQKDLDSSRAITMEKDGNIVDLEHKLSDITETKKLLEEKNKSLLNDVTRCTIALQEENERFRVKIRDLGTSATTDPVSKDVELRGLKTRRPLFPQKPLSPQNGKGNGLPEKPKPKPGIENRAPSTTKGNTAKAEVEKRSPKEPVSQKQSPKETVPQKRSPKERVSQKPSPKEPVPQKRSPKESVLQKLKPKWL